jgi:hypothetical protein
MAANHHEGYRSLRAPGLGAEMATELTHAALAARPGLSVHGLAPGRISVARTRRPRWALLLCAATCWLAGLGFLFLLVRRTESGEVVVSDGPRGCVVALPPVVDAGAAEAVEVALRRAEGHGGAAGSEGAAGPATGDDLDDRTVARRDLPPRAAGRSGAPARRLELRFASGTVTVEAGCPVVLGRDPSTTDDVVGRVVPGDATTVSKAHLRVEFDGETATVEDLGSTNGSRLVHANGEQRLVPGTPRAVADGDEVVLGALALVVSMVGHR